MPHGGAPQPTVCIRHDYIDLVITDGNYVKLDPSLLFSPLHVTHPQSGVPLTPVCTPHDHINLAVLMSTV